MLNESVIQFILKPIWNTQYFINYLNIMIQHSRNLQVHFVYFNFNFYRVTYTIISFTRCQNIIIPAKYDQYIC